jgi:phospholipase A1
MSLFFNRSWNTVKSLGLIVLLVVPLKAQDTSEVFEIIQTGPGLSLHKEMFALPATYSDAYHGVRTEFIAQLSFKHRIFGSRFYAAYTQISFWQAYDKDNSAPFRETNYNPEIFYRTGRFPLYTGQIGADIGFEHESNGQKPPVSRSWNLLYACPYYYHSNFLLYLKFRYRIPEKAKEFQLAAEGDDNPDITDYLGYSDFNIFYRLLSDHQVHIRIRGNVSTGKGSIMLNYSVPVPMGKASYINLRLFHGYGESLVDYNRYLTRVGLGMMFAR